jgi:alpha-D-ribose 1-methylphosphonate 5-triphosphate synthase subunit PhnG
LTLHEDDTRRTWIRSLALADGKHLRKLWTTCDLQVAFEFVSAPETELVPIRVALPAASQPMVLGDLTITRATIRLRSGELGFGFVAGHAPEHATTAAICDALLQTVQYGPRVRTEIIEPLLGDRAARRARDAASVAATRLDTLDTSVWNT